MKIDFNEVNYKREYTPPRQGLANRACDVIREEVFCLHLLQVNCGNVTNERNIKNMYSIGAKVCSFTKQNKFFGGKFSILCCRT